MIEGLDRLMNRVSKIRGNVKDVDKPMRAAGVLMVGSIQKNFNAGGRPTKWPKLAASTVRQRRRGSGKGGVKPLMDTGRLRASHSFRMRSNGVEAGTNMVQAKRQHFGYPGGKGRGRSKTPARPFVMFQEEDSDAIGKLFMRHIRS